MMAGVVFIFAILLSVAIIANREKDKELAVQEKQLAAQEKKLAEKDKEIAKKNEMLAGQAEIIHIQKGIIQSQEEIIQGLVETLKEKEYIRRDMLTDLRNQLKKEKIDAVVDAGGGSSYRERGQDPRPAFGQGEGVVTPVFST